MITNVKYQMKTERGYIPIEVEANTLAELTDKGWAYSFTVNGEDIYANSDDMYHHNFARVVGKDVVVPIKRENILSRENSPSFFTDDAKKMINIVVPTRYVDEWVTRGRAHWRTMNPDGTINTDKTDVEYFVNFLQQNHYSVRAEKEVVDAFYHDHPSLKKDDLLFIEKENIL